jgi:hypothetical protein
MSFTHTATLHLMCVRRGGGQRCSIVTDYNYRLHLMCVTDDRGPTLSSFLFKNSLTLSPINDMES